MGKLNYRTDEINKKLKQIDELVGNNETLLNQINNFNSQLDTIKNKTKESINVKYFGVKGDGVTDDTAILQELLDNYVQRELDKCSDPVLNIVIEVSNSGIFDIFGIKKGDSVTLNLNCLKLNSKIKIMEYTIHPKTLTATITLGNCYFRPNKPNMYRF